MQISSEANGDDRQVHAIQTLAELAYCLALSMMVVDQDSLLLLIKLRPVRTCNQSISFRATDLLSLLESVFPAGGIHRNTIGKIPLGYGD